MAGTKQSKTTKTTGSKHSRPSKGMPDDDSGDDCSTLNGGSESDSQGTGTSEAATPVDSPPVKAAKRFGIGLACIVGLPVVAALATAGGVLYGAGKVLEGVGQIIVAGPEAAANAFGGSKDSAPNPEQPKRKSTGSGKGKKSG